VFVEHSIFFVLAAWH